MKRVTSLKGTKRLGRNPQSSNTLLTFGEHITRWDNFALAVVFGGFVAGGGGGGEEGGCCKHAKC